MPWLAAAFVLLMLVLHWQIPLDLLWYSRSGLGAGEFWRLLSGHFVHFSFEHLGGNLVVFAMLATLVELRDGSLRLLGLLLYMAVTISLALLLLVPLLHIYTGVSALNYGLAGWLCVTQLVPGSQKMQPRQHSHMALLAWLALLVHSLYQGVSGASLLSAADTETGIRVAWQAHLAALLCVSLLAIACTTAVTFPRTLLRPDLS